MREHDLLLQRHSGHDEDRRHNGRVAVDHSNWRRCSERFEIVCDDGGKPLAAFALYYCDREALAFVAISESIKGKNVQDLMTTAVEACFDQSNRVPHLIEWLFNNRSSYIAADIKALALTIGLQPCPIPVQNPQSKCTAKDLVRIIKHDYVRVSPRSDARAVIA